MSTSDTSPTVPPTRLVDSVPFGWVRGEMYYSMEHGLWVNDLHPPGTVVIRLGKASAGDREGKEGERRGA
jgi:hypothetical protein